jgi:hypothetical protein
MMRPETALSAQVGVLEKIGLVMPGRLEEANYGAQLRP